MDKKCMCACVLKLEMGEKRIEDSKKDRWRVFCILFSNDLHSTRKGVRDCYLLSVSALSPLVLPLSFFFHFIHIITIG